MNETTRCMKFTPLRCDRLETPAETVGAYVDEDGRLALAFDGVAVRVELHPDVMMLLAIKLGDLAVARIVGASPIAGRGWPDAGISEVAGHA